jgi:putative membrane protein
MVAAVRKAIAALGAKPKRIRTNYSLGIAKKEIDMMYGWDGGGGGILMILLMALFVAAIVVGIVLLVRGSTASRGPAESSQTAAPTAPSPPPKSGALQLLEERYARGEIQREEFMQRRQDLLGGS